MLKIGLIAGRGSFPLLFAQGAKKQGYSVVSAAVRGETSPKLKNFVDKISWVRVWEFSKILEIFKKEGIKDIAMAGQIHPCHLFNKRVIESPEFAPLLNSLKDRKADSIFGAVAKELESSGFKLADSTKFLKEYMPEKGVLTISQPNLAQWEDVYFGFEAAKHSAAFDIGQTVAVKNKTVVAVEALEGTDNTIKRAGLISRGGAIIVKVSKPNQDMRFDIPVVGLNTVKSLIKSKSACLAIEAEKTLLLDRDASLRLANSKDICIVAV